MTDLAPIQWSSILWPFAVAFLICAIFTPIALWFAKRRNLFDQPNERKIHQSPIPRLGGIAIFFAILLTTLFFFPGDSRLIGLELGMIIIFIIGLLDDLYTLPATAKLAGQLAAAATVIFFGITIGHLTNPLGGPSVGLSPIVDVVATLVWIMLVINTINLLDALDGLAAGVSGITALALVALSLTLVVNQPDTASLAAILAGGAFGFLILNWHPAKIFMGDSGSHVLGFTIATLAIFSGGKMATAALVLAIPIIDVLWAFLRRVWQGRSPFSADRGHLHHLMLDLGLSQPQAVGLMYLMALGVGSSALVAGPVGKITIMLGVAIAVTIILALVSYFRRKV